MQVATRLLFPDISTFVPKTPRAVWTLIGCLAIPLWATWPLLAALTTSTMPLSQYFPLAYASGATVLFLVPEVSGTVTTDQPRATS